MRQHARAAARLVGAIAVAVAAVAGDPPAGGPPKADAPAGDLRKGDPLDVRVMSYNHHGDFMDDPAADAAFDRILAAVAPDVICFQEFDGDISAAQIAARLAAVLPAAGGWHVHLGALAGRRTVLASRYPLQLTRADTTPEAATRGVAIALVDLPDTDYPRDLYLLGVHLKCCGRPGGKEDASRQRSADAIANWLGDARGVARPGGDHVRLPGDTPIVVLGDFNFVGGPQPELTLRSGDVQDEQRYGPDVPGDWDATDLLDVAPADPFTGATFTWQGNRNFPPSRLDRFYVTDSAARVAASFVLNTDTMTPEALAAAGLLAGDTLPRTTSDHLPIVLDLRLAAACPADLTGDGRVDVSDLSLLLADFGAVGPSRPADVDGDHDVDASDLGLLLAAFDEPCGRAGSTP